MHSETNNKMTGNMLLINNHTKPQPELEERRCVPSFIIITNASQRCVRTNEFTLYSSSNFLVDSLAQHNLNIFYTSSFENPAAFGSEYERSDDINRQILSFIYVSEFIY